MKMTIEIDVFNKDSITKAKEIIHNLTSTSKEVKVEEAKVEEVKVEKAKVEKAKVEKAKVEKAKVEKAKVEKAKVELTSDAISKLAREMVTKYDRKTIKDIINKYGVNISSIDVDDYPALISDLEAL